MQTIHIFLFFAVYVSRPAMAQPISLVSTSPEVTELLFQLGHGTDIVATSDMSEFPEAAKALPKLGPLFMPSIERTLRFKPNWVILDESNLSPTYERALQATRTPSLKISYSRVEDLFTEAIRLLRTIYAETTNVPIENARRCLNSIPRIRTGTFLIFVWLSPPILAADHTFLSDLVSKSGGKNAAPTSWSAPYPQVSEEWLLQRKIDTVFYFNELPGDTKTATELASHWWPGRPVRLLGLRPQSFARVSFTPLHHLEELGIAREALGEDCFEPTH